MQFPSKIVSLSILNGKSTSIRGAPKTLCDADNGNTNIELNGGRSAPVAVASPSKTIKNVCSAESDLDQEFTAAIRF